MRDAASFRDPAGFVFWRDGVCYRQVNASHRADYDLLRTNGLYDALVARRLLVPHDEVDVAPPEPERAFLVLRPKQVPFLSYAHEWCFSQLRDAALATLDAQEEALTRGMTLKDAPASNVQLVDGRPVLIDTLSFVRRKRDAPWDAYGQFCRHFLAPLALMSFVDAGAGRLHLAFPDGVPLDVAARALPRRARWRPRLMMHLALHARAQRPGSPMSVREAPRVGDAAMLGLVRSLRRAVEGLGAPTHATTWGRYAPSASYPGRALDEKRRIVGEMLEAAHPRVVWDIGANTGEYSRLAAAKGARLVVSLDDDPTAIETSYAAGEARVLPLVADVAHPSPGLGWRNAERPALLGRGGGADLVLALAVVHHLAITRHVPLRDVVHLFAEIAPALIVEFVPKTDPQVREMLALREDVFEDHTQKAFEEALHARYALVETTPIPGSERVLYFARRAPS